MVASATTWRYRSPNAAVASRASPHVPDCVARWTEPGREKKNAVWTEAGLATAGNGGNSAFALSMSTNAGSMASTADVSARLACSPFAMSKNSVASSGVIPSQ